MTTDLVIRVNVREATTTTTTTPDGNIDIVGVLMCNKNGFYINAQSDAFFAFDVRFGKYIFST